MARKEISLTIQDGEDNLTFTVRQMSCTATVGWGIRAVIALAKSGIEFPEGMGLQEAIAHIAENGPSAVMKTLGGLEYESVQPLLDDLLGCCSRVIGNHAQKCTPESVDDYLSDPKTLMALYVEAFKINFMMPGLPAENG